MIPLRDTIPSRTVPIVNYLLICANVLVFFLLLLGGRGAEWWVDNLGVVPARLLDDPASPGWITLLTSQFLHGGWFHLISNMWALFIFGDNVEDRLGSLRYLLFYLLGGMAGGLAHVFSDPGSTVPAIGASGAISTVMAAYLVSFPRAKILTLVPVFFLPWIIALPAIVFIGLWFASQLLSGFLAISVGAQALGGVAYWAHIGGFVFGLVFLPVFRIGRGARRPFADERLPW